MNNDLTAIAVVLDSSGSMAHLTSDTIGNFNSFLKEQKEFPGEALFTLCTFNSTYHLVHDNVKIQSVEDLDLTAYKPQGNTALLDAMGFTIDSLGKKLAAMPEAERPSKILLLTVTDGHENSSKEFTADQIKSMV